MHTVGRGRDSSVPLLLPFLVLSSQLAPPGPSISSDVVGIVGSRARTYVREEQGMVMTQLRAIGRLADGDVCGGQPRRDDEQQDHDDLQAAADAAARRARPIAAPATSKATAAWRIHCGASTRAGLFVPRGLIRSDVPSSASVPWERGPAARCGRSRRPIRVLPLARVRLRHVDVPSLQTLRLTWPVARRGPRGCPVLAPL